MTPTYSDRESGNPGLGSKRTKRWKRLGLKADEADAELTVWRESRDVAGLLTNRAPPGGAGAAAKLREPYPSALAPNESPIRPLY